MQPLDHAALKRHLHEVFRKFYDEEVADCLAVMHAQLHVKFARGLAEVPVQPGEVGKLVKSAYRVSSAIHRVREERNSTSTPPTKGEHATAAYEEIASFMQSVGAEVGLSQIESHVSAFGVGSLMARKAVRRLLEEGKVAEPKKHRYVWSEK